jgi:hypothetical protein
MRLLREFFEKLLSAVAVQRPLSGFICEGCDLREHCRLPVHRRQLCSEIRALRPRW